MTKRLREAAVLGNSLGNGKWRVRYIQEGLSKNGIDYKGSVLKQYSGVAMPKGTRMLANHDENAPYTGGNVQSIAGKTISDPEYIPGDGVYGNVQIRAGKWREFVEEFHDQIGLSINVAGDSAPRGKFKEALNMKADPYNSIDIVLAPSAGGKFDQRLMESYREVSGIDLSDNGAGKPVADSRNEREIMEEKDFERLLEKFLAPVTERLTALETATGKVPDTFLESVKAALPEAPETATVDAAFEAGMKVAKSGLPETVQGRLKEGFIAAPGDVDRLVESEIKIRDEYLRESAVTPIGSFASSQSTESPKAPSAWAVPTKAGV